MGPLAIVDVTAANDYKYSVQALYLISYSDEYTPGYWPRCGFPPSKTTPLPRLPQIYLHRYQDLSAVPAPLRLSSKHVLFPFRIQLARG